MKVKRNDISNYVNIPQLASFQIMIRLLACFLLIGEFSSGQIKLGVYSQNGDTLFFRKGSIVTFFPDSSKPVIDTLKERAWLTNYAEILINADKTFGYNNRGSASCLLWYNLSGIWYTKKDYLYLVDTIPTINKPKETTLLLRITVFKIENNLLKYVNYFFNHEVPEKLFSRSITGNFIYKEK